MSLVICGFSRAGTSLLYAMLRSTVINYRTLDHESPALPQDRLITKRPLDLFKNFDYPRIIMIRDPRAVLTSIHVDYPKQYFMSWDQCVAGTAGLKKYYERFKEIKDDHAVIKYEDLISHPDKIQKKLQEVFEFAYNGTFENFHTDTIPPNIAKPMNGIRPLDQGHDWRDHLLRIKEQIDHFPEILQAIKDLGYA